MPPQRFIPRPPTFEYLQWTGDNFAEIQTWVKPPGKVHKNPDGTLTYTSPAGHGVFIVQLTDWIGDALVTTDEDLNRGSSRVEGNPPFAYTIAGT